MTAPTITGRLTMQSLNGDSAQLLTEAAEFVTALAQIGVQLGVRIELAPVDASQPAVPEPPPNPTPARAAQPTPRVPYSTRELDVTPDQWPQILSELDSGKRQFRSLSRESRLDALLTYGRSLTAELGHVPSQGEWDRSKPHWMPTGAANVSRGHPGWPQGWPEWQTRFATSTDTSSGASE